MKIKSLTIYCSASQIIDKKFLKIAKETAEIISKYKIYKSTFQKEITIRLWIQK